MQHRKQFDVCKDIVLTDKYIYYAHAKRYVNTYKKSK